MPDRDVFPGLHRSWRRVGRAVCGAQPSEFVASLAEKALAEQLRTDGLGPHQLSQAAAALAHSDDPSAVDAVVDEGDRSRSIILRALCAEVQAVTRLRQDAGSLNERDILIGALSRVVQTQLQVLRPRLVYAVFQSAHEATQYLARCADGVRVELLAEQVARGDRRIRAPRRTLSRTADLLYEPLT